MSLVPCPQIIVRERVEAPPQERWRARFIRLPMKFDARTRSRAITAAEAWWAEQQALRAQRNHLAAVRAEANRRTA